MIEGILQELWQVISVPYGVLLSDNNTVAISSERLLESISKAGTIGIRCIHEECYRLRMQRLFREPGTYSRLSRVRRRYAEEVGRDSAQRDAGCRLGNHWEMCICEN